MPAIHLHHLAPRFTTNAGSGGISATAIGLLVGVGLIPALILIWVVCWLLFAYPHDRNICCCARKRKADTLPPMMQRGSSDTSEETLNEKPEVTMPKRPYAAGARTEFRSASGEEGVRVQRSGREGCMAKQKDDRPVWRERNSGLSEGSGDTDVEVQEPKRFV